MLSLMMMLIFFVIAKQMRLRYQFLDCQHYNCQTRWFAHPELSLILILGMCALRFVKQFHYNQNFLSCQQFKNFHYECLQSRMFTKVLISLPFTFLNVCLKPLLVIFLIYILATIIAYFSCIRFKVKLSIIQLSQKICQKIHQIGVNL